MKKYKGNVSIETTDDQFVIDIVMENTEPLERIKKKIRRKASKMKVAIVDDEKIWLEKNKKLC